MGETKAHDSFDDRCNKQRHLHMTALMIEALDSSTFQHINARGEGQGVAAFEKVREALMVGNKNKMRTIHHLST